MRSGNAVVEAALRAGWKTDEESNIVALPNSAGAREKLREGGIDRPLDDSGHPEWNAGVIATLDKIGDELDADFGKGDSSAKDVAARQALEALSRSLRQNILSKPRVTQDDRPHAPSAA